MAGICDRDETEQPADLEGARWRSAPGLRRGMDHSTREAGDSRGHKRWAAPAGSGRTARRPCDPGGRDAPGRTKPAAFLPHSGDGNLPWALLPGSVLVLSRPLGPIKTRYRNEFPARFDRDGSSRTNPNPTWEKGTGASPGPRCVSPFCRMSPPEGRRKRDRGQSGRWRFPLPTRSQSLRLPCK